MNLLVEEFIDKLSDYQLVKKDCSPCSYLVSQSVSQSVRSTYVHAGRVSLKCWAPVGRQTVNSHKRGSHCASVPYSRTKVSHEISKVIQYQYSDIV